MNVLDEVARLQAEAKGQRSTGDGSTALSTLDRAVGLLEAEFARADPTPTTASTLAGELAETHGLRGGVLKDLSRLGEAAEAYDAGHAYESDARFGLDDTYNALNRIIVRIEMEPGCLADPEVLRRHDDVSYIDVPQALAGLAETLERQTEGARAGDPWVYGDAALVAILRGVDDSAVWDGFLATEPSDHARAAYVRTVEELEQLDVVAPSVADTARTRLGKE